MRNSLWVSVMALIMAITLPVDALTITHNGSPVFSDDFEAYDGFRPDVDEPPGDPNWIVFGDDDPSETDVVWVETSGGAIPPVAQGTNYLNVTGVVTTFSIIGEPWRSFGFNRNSGIFRAEFALYDEIGQRGLGAILRWMPLPAAEAKGPPWVALRSDNYDLHYFDFNTQSWVDTGLDLNNPPTIWNVVIFEVDLDLNLASVTVNGQTFAGLPVDPAVEIGAFVIRADEHSVTGIDAFPDPQDCDEVLAQGHSVVGDIDRDCYVGLVDFGLLSANWLECIDPTDNNCSEPWLGN